MALQRADGEEEARLDSSTLAVLAREAMARALFTVLTPLGWGEPGPRPGGEAGAVDRPPVLLIAGPRWNRVTLSFLRTFLLARGWVWVHPITLPGGDPSLADLAEHVASAVAALRRAAEAPQVDVVAFSEAGLAAAWYATHLDGEQAIRRLVTLGTPWHGTRTANFTRGRLSEQTRRNATELDALRPPAVPTTAIWSADDPVVVPSGSALPDGAESVEIVAAGHVEMLVSARVFRAVLAALADAMEVPG